jgi:hypothetical protein
MFFPPLSGFTPFQQIFAVSPPRFSIFLLHQKKTTEMKTTLIITLTLIIFQINSLFAGNKIGSVTENRETISSITAIYPPSTPNEATFEEMAAAEEVAILSPVTPKEATFEDAPEETCIADLAPVTPKEADFTDSEPEDRCEFVTMAPTTPAEADFPEEF